jgi:hypothetical protein
MLACAGCHPVFFLNLPGGYLSADWNSLNIKWRARSWETPRFFPFLSRIAHGHGSFKMHTGWWHHRGACQVQALEPWAIGKWVLSHGQFLVPFCLPQPCNDQSVLKILGSHCYCSYHSVPC